MSKLIHLFVIAGLFFSSIAPATTFAAPAVPPSSVRTAPVRANSSQAATAQEMAYWENPASMPLLPQDGSAPAVNQPNAAKKKKPRFRTTVRIRGVADLARLKKMKIKILASTHDTATVIVRRRKLKLLAKLSFLPQQTEIVTRLKKNGSSALTEAATASDILAAAATDTDSDGLNDTEEGWWCTDPAAADSDNDQVNDGVEVQGLRDWIQHTVATRPASGKPFAGWPPNHTGCYDSDYDSVPDAVEVYVFGLNPNRESTARDKFDDGQKLFGLTNCPGSGGGCGYGALPRLVDWGVIFAEMPSWVKPPYDSPFVAAFPDPDVEVVPGSFVVTAKTTITTDRTVSEGEAKTYGTSETQGSSDARADTTTWNSWHEVSLSGPVPSSPSSSSPSAKAAAVGQSDADKLTDVVLGVGGCYGIGNWKKLITVTGGFSRVFTLGSCLKFIKDNLHYVTDYFNPPVVYSDGFGNDPPIQDFQQGQNACYIQGAQLAPSNIKQASLESASSTDACRVAGSNIPTSDEYLKFEGTSLASSQQNAGSSGHSYVYGGDQVQIQKVIPMTVPIAQPPPIETVTNGESHGGALTLTHTEYQEHTISQASTKQFGQSWSNATAQDTARAADLTFTYKLSNQGTDYAREISDIAFNIYLGDNPNPIYTYYPKADIIEKDGGSGKFINFMPGESHIYTSAGIPLTLDQMKAIDTGESIYIVVEDFSYGVDELFYQDAVNSGATFHVDSGDGILHSYVLPTWGSESIQDVAKRFFPVTEDDGGNLLSLSVPHYETTTPNWVSHPLLDNAWWNLYLDNLGDGSSAFKDTPASADSMVLIRMNKDTDRDGYSDRTETALGTDLNDPALHPTPQLTAVTRAVRTGDDVTVTMSFLNGGDYDAYGIEAVVYAPDGTTTINNNTIGGSGRVRSGQQVVLGSRILPADATNWHGSSKPFSDGSYTGSTDKTFTFTAQNAGNIGQGTVTIHWDDGAGNSGNLDFGSSYQAPLPLAVRDGLQIGFNTGAVNSGDTFTVAAQLPRDTFQYHVNTGANPYTKPVVVVSYNDPQGNHKFITPIEVSDLGANIAGYADDMLFGVGVDIATTAPFNASGSNTVYLIANSPDSTPITDGHIFAEFVDDAGNVVDEQDIAATFQPGPNVQSVTFNGTSFPNFASGHDYTLLAFFTDSQGNIIDSHARLFSTFAADPVPLLNPSPAVWDFGTVTQGDTPQKTISLVNTGTLPLNVVVTASDPKITLSNAASIISIAPAGTHDVVASLDTADILPGSVSMNITVRSNDPAHQTTTIPVNGTIEGNVAQANAFDIDNQPLTKRVRVYDDVNQYATADFSHNITPDAASIEPCLIYGSNGTTLKGVGKYCADFGGATLPYQVFGEGADNDLDVSPGQTAYTDNTRSYVSANAPAGQPSVSIASSAGFNVGDEVFVIQTRGAGAGNFEFGKVISKASNSLTLDHNLKYEYNRQPTVTLYDGPNYTGASASYTSDQSCIAFNDVAESVKINGYGAELRTDCNFGGGGTWLWADEPDLGAAGVGNNNVSSLRITNGSPDAAQVIRVPHYRNVTVQAGGLLTAHPWDGSTGGILLFRASGIFEVQSGGSVSLDGKGYRGGNGGIQPPQNPSEPTGFAGESRAGYSGDRGEWTYGPRYGGGGGGGARAAPDSPPENNNGRAGGGGGSHGSGGGCGQTINKASAGCGGYSFGSFDLTTQLFPGAGGGGGGGAQGYYAGNGGGIVAIYAIQTNIYGTITSNGSSGNNGPNNNGAGGGGAGGSIFIQTAQGDLGQNLITAIGGSGGASGGWNSGYGGNGGNGIIDIRYCNSISGTTTPTVVPQKVICYIAEKTDDATIHYTVPDQITNGKNYIMHFGRRYSFPSAGTLITPTLITAQTYMTATMDALVTNVGAGGSTTINISVGSQALPPITQTITQPTSIPIPNFYQALNQALSGQPVGTSVSVPISVNINRQADVILTNMVLTPGADIDLAVGSGDFTNSNANPSEGDTIPLQLVIHNDGAKKAASAVVGFYAGDPENGGKLLGNAYVASINAGGTANANFDWVTTGYTHTQTIYAFVDPPNAIPEAIETNNIISQTVNIKTKPDLRVADIAFDQTDRVVGESIQVTATISNTGETPSLASTTHLAALGERADSLSQDLPTNGINPGTTLTVSATIAPTLFGTHVITFTADSAAAVTETIETNNILTRTVYVGLNPPDIDSGDAGDTAYSAASGYGYLNGSSFSFASTLTGTVRYDGSGALQYRFDGLQPSRFYHLDAVFYQEGDTVTEDVLFDGASSGQAVTLNDGVAANTSLLVPAAAYADGTLTVTFQRTNGSGPAFVSEVALVPIEYVYVDAGSASDAAYSASRGYGYLDGFASGSGSALNTYRSSFNNAVNYQYDGLDPAKRYTIDLTFYDAGGTNRIQQVQADGTTICGPFTLSTTLTPKCELPSSTFADGSVVIKIQRTNGTGPIVNEIALHELTRDVIGSSLSPTPTPTATMTPTVTPTPTMTPTSTPVGPGPVVIAVAPMPTQVAVNEVFSVTVQVQAGTQQVDGASAYVDFDPALLEVESVTAGSTFTATLQNTFDNTNGRVNFSAGNLAAPYPSGTFTLTTITFLAKTTSAGTALDFADTLPRQTDATYGGSSVFNLATGASFGITDDAVLNGSVLLAGRPTPPAPVWSVPLTVSLYRTGDTSPRYVLTPTTDTQGHFTLNGIVPGAYQARVKHSHTLETRLDVTLVTGSNTVDFGTLREGDANNDNYVTLVDFSILATTFGKCTGDAGFDARADFDDSGCVVLLDFSLLASNFGKSGSAPVQAAKSPARTKPKKSKSSSDVFLSIVPATVQAVPAQVFTLDVQVQSGTQPVDGASAYLNFDPTLLQVNSVTSGGTLPLVLQNAYDNTAGTVDFAAGTFSNFPSGTFSLVQVEFEVLQRGTSSVVFNTILPRKSDVTYGGASVLTGVNDASIAVPTATDLVSFSAHWKKRAVLVTWETGYELGTLGYRVERSRDGTNFVAVGDMIPVQGLVGGAKYRLRDKRAPRTESVYYRLIQVKTGNTEEIRETIQLDAKVKPTPTPTPAPARGCEVVPGSVELLSPDERATVNTRQLQLDWSDDTCATRYQVQVRQDSKKGKKVSGKRKLAASEYLTQPLTAGETYVWRARACNNVGCGKWSDWRQVTIGKDAARLVPGSKWYEANLVTMFSLVAFPLVH